MTTINDIAKLVGVTKSTVSRYLNGGSVSKRTKAKIDAVIQETGYMPNVFAQSLKAKESRMIGVVVPRLDSSSAASILSEIDRYLKQHQYQVLIMNSDFSLQQEQQALRTCQVNKMDGIIYLLSHVDQPLIDLINAATVPVVTIGQELSVESSISYDEAGAGHQLADYLYHSGHRVIDYLNVSVVDDAIGVKRRNALKERFLSYQETQWREYTTSFRLMDSYEVVKQEVLAHHPTLIVGATDSIAIGAMHACLEAGYQVPNQVSFAGFGDTVLSHAVYPSLTTVHYPYQEAGRLAATLLLDKIRGQSSVVQPQLATQLVIRDSVHTQAMGESGRSIGK